MHEVGVRLDVDVEGHGHGVRNNEYINESPVLILLRTPAAGRRWELMEESVQIFQALLSFPGVSAWQ